MHIRIGFRSYTIPIGDIYFLPPIIIIILFVCLCILDNSNIIPVLLFTPGLILLCLLFFRNYYPKNDWLVFDDDFNDQITNVVFPTGIQKIRFGWHFNQEIRNLPNSLTHLIFGFYFNQEIRNLPNSLTHLTFGHDFNQKMHNLPNSLTHLTFGWCFNQEMHNLPKSITYLIFNYWSDHRFNHNLNPYLYYLTEFYIKEDHKHKSLMLNRCRVNRHNSAIRNDKLIDLLLKK